MGGTEPTTNSRQRPARRRSQSFQYNARERHDMLESPRANSAPLAFVPELLATVKVDVFCDAARSAGRRLARMQSRGEMGKHRLAGHSQVPFSRGQRACVPCREDLHRLLPDDSATDYPKR